LWVHRQALNLLADLAEVLVEHRQGPQEVFSVFALHRFQAPQHFTDLSENFQECVQVAGCLLPADLHIQPGRHGADGAEDARLLGVGADGFALAQLQQKVVQGAEVSRHFRVKAKSAVGGFGDEFGEFCQV